MNITAIRKTIGHAVGRWVPALILAGVFSSSASAASTLDFISFTSLPDDGVELQFTFTGTPPQPTSATTADPAVITLDMPEVNNNLPWSLPLPIEVGAVQTVSAEEKSGNTRVAINLTDLVTYETRVSGNNLFVTLASPGAAEAASAESLAEPAPVGEVSTSGLQQEAPPAEKAPASEVQQPPVDLAAEEAAMKAPQQASRNGTNKIRNMTWTSLPDNQVRIMVELEKAAAKPTSFKIDDPARIAFDFQGTESGLPWKNRNIGIGFARSVTAVQTGKRTRVIVNLVKMMGYETQVNGNKVAITLSASGVSGRRGGSRFLGTTGPAFSIENIDFRRGEKEQGRVVVYLSESTIPIDTREQGGKIIVDFSNTHIPNDLIQRLDVLDFATPVQFIDTSSVDGQARLVITPAGFYEFLAFQSDKVFTIEVKPLSKAEIERKKKDKESKFQGETLSLNFQDIEVRDVLQLLADFTNLNMVASDSVSGSVTLRLINVPWDQALDIILKSKGLAMRKSGNVLMVAPQDEIASREQLELEANKQVEELAPLQSELIQVNYAKASDLASILSSQDQTLLSSRGKVTVDERTNTILVLETSDRLENIRSLVAELDVPVRQVLVESRIVIANNDFAKDIGVRFGVTGWRDSGSDVIFSAGTTNATDEMWSSYVDSGGTTVEVPSGPGGLPQRLNVNMPVASGGNIAFAILGAGSLLDLELSALQTEGRGEVISSPRVITADQATAIIEQGTEVPYQEASSSGSTTVAFKKAVLSLEVTPHITPDDRIQMELGVTKDSVGTIVPTAEGGSSPSIDTRSIETKVLVASGETVVLGGIHEKTRTKSERKVPFFGDLPFIGNLFRTRRQLDNNNELLIFVTPKILQDDLTIR